MFSYFMVALTLTSSAISEDATGPSEIKKLSTMSACIMPPYPENGFYLPDTEGKKPGDRVNNFIVNVTCMPGYNLVGNNEFLCLSGQTSGFMPECLPYCNTDEESYIVTCEAKALRCVLNPKIVFGSRRIHEKDDYECGELGAFYENVIAGGHRAGNEELPWHAGIYKKTTTPYMQICGGSLVSNNVIISAAHCFWNDVEKLQPATKFAVAVGKLYRPWNNEHDLYVQKSDVQDIKIPVRFLGSATNFQDDIAIVIVTTSFTYSHRVMPVCLSFDHQLDEKQLQDGNYGKVGGWGLTGEDEKASQVLKAVDMPYVDLQKCISGSPPGFIPYITSDKICAGYRNGTAVCKGDSGGGLVFPEEIKFKVRHYLRGIVSTAPNSEHSCNVFAWGTFTHVIDHERFIRTTLRGDVPEVTGIEASPVTENVSRGIFITANLMNHGTKKPLYQWV